MVVASRTGITHLVHPLSRFAAACNMGLGRYRMRKSCPQPFEAAGPSCSRCQGMLRRGTHPNLTTRA